MLHARRLSLAINFPNIDGESALVSMRVDLGVRKIAPSENPV